MPSPARFRESLAVFGVDAAVVAAIEDGHADVNDKSTKRKKALYFKRATQILTERLPPDTVRDVLVWNACCKTGNRLKASRAFAKENAGLPLAEKLQKAAALRYMGRAEVNADGTITLHAVNYQVADKFACGCPNFNGLKTLGAVKKEYCYCCAGHFQFHYEVMLGVKLRALSVISSPLDSEGREPCAFVYEVVG